MLHWHGDENRPFRTKNLINTELATETHYSTLNAAVDWPLSN